MILYCYQCPNCSLEFEDYNEVDTRQICKCPKCGYLANQIIRMSDPRDWFKPFIHEDFEDNPVEVKSRRHYKDLCKKYGVRAICLE